MLLFNTAGAFSQFNSTYGIGNWTITQIVNAHEHTDHTAGNAGLVQATGAKVLAPVPAIVVGVEEKNSVAITGEMGESGGAEEVMPVDALLLVYGLQVRPRSLPDTTSVSWTTGSSVSVMAADTSSRKSSNSERSLKRTAALRVACIVIQSHSRL